MEEIITQIKPVEKLINVVIHLNPEKHQEYKKICREKGIVWNHFLLTAIEEKIQRMKVGNLFVK